MKVFRHRLLITALALLGTSQFSSAIAQSCSEGCTPGYWKNHTERWDGVGNDDYTNTIQHQLSFNAVLGVVEAQSGVPDSTTLLDAASTGGGGVTALNRHAAAAVASADTAIFYPFDLAQVISLYQDAVGAIVGDETVDSVHLILESANELGCPLGNNWEPSEGFCTYCYADDTDCPCGVPYPNGGCTNSTGVGGILTPTGSASWAADDLVLTATQLPPNRPAIFFMAPAMNRNVIRDGLLCVAPGHLKIFRFPATVSDANGTAVFGPGIVNASANHPVAVAEILPGDTRNFQCYYRDVNSPCGNDANTTNAVQAQFY